MATLRLRITPPRGAAEPLALAIAPSASGEGAIDRALAEASRRLLLDLDPVALAAHLLLETLERLPAESGEGEALDGLQAVVTAVNACRVAPRCGAEDRARARLIWATAARRAARRMGARDSDTGALLIEEALAQLDRAGWPEGREPIEAVLRRADLLWERGEREDAFARFERAATGLPREPGRFATGPRRSPARAIRAEPWRSSNERRG